MANNTATVPQQSCTQSFNPLILFECLNRYIRYQCQSIYFIRQVYLVGVGQRCSQTASDNVREHLATGSACIYREILNLKHAVFRIRLASSTTEGAQRASRLQRILARRGGVSRHQKILARHPRPSRSETASRCDPFPPIARE